MNELQLRTTEMFGEVQTDIYENENHEMFMTARQLGECLGYKSKSGIDMLINRNPYLKDEEFSGTHHLLEGATNDKVTTLDSYYTNFINDNISELRNGNMVYVFKLHQLWEILRFVDGVQAVYQGDGIIGLTCEDSIKSKNKKMSDLNAI